jgi:hypothetical protein
LKVKELQIGWQPIRTSTEQRFVKETGDSLSTCNGPAGTVTCYCRSAQSIVISNETVLTWGKWPGKTFVEVYKIDADYCRWVLEKFRGPQQPNQALFIKWLTTAVTTETGERKE